MKKLLLAIAVLALSAGIVDAQALGRNAVVFGSGSSSWASAVTSDIHALQGLWNTTSNLFLHTQQGGGSGIDWQLDQITYSVKAFGATGNCSSDDLSAFTSAIAAAEAQGGGTIYAPDPGTSGCYRVSNAITLSGATGIAIVGDGASIVGTNDANDVILVTGNSRHIKIEGLTISHLNHLVRGGHGVRVNGSSDIAIERNKFTTTAGGAVWIDQQSARVTVEKNDLENTFSDAIDVTGGSTDTTVSNNHILNSGDDCIAILGFTTDAAQTTGATVVGNTCRGSNTRGITVVGASGVTLGANVIDTTVDACIYVAQEGSNSTLGSTHVDVIGNTLNNCNTGYLSTPQGSILVAGTDATKQVLNIQVIGNLVYGGGYRFIFATNNGVANSLDSITVSNNRCFGPNTSGSGIEFDGVRTGEIVDNKVYFATASGVWADTNSTQILERGNYVYKPNQGNTTGILGVYNGSSAGITSMNEVTPDGTKTALSSTVNYVNFTSSTYYAFSEGVNATAIQTNGGPINAGSLDQSSSAQLVIGGNNATSIAFVNSGSGRYSIQGNNFFPQTDGVQGIGADTLRLSGVFSVNTVAEGARATSGTQLVNSGGFYARGQYWNGSASTNADSIFSTVVDSTTPAAHVKLTVLGNEVWDPSSGGAVGQKVGSSIASATTIAPVAAITHITGTTTIQTITAPTVCTISGNGCKVVFVFDGVAPWNAAGNIFVAGTPTTAGTTVDFTYDNATSKWYPSRTS